MFVQYYSQLYQFFFCFFAWGPGPQVSAPPPEGVVGIDLGAKPRMTRQGAFSRTYRVLEANAVVSPPTGSWEKKIVPGAAQLDVITDLRSGQQGQFADGGPGFQFR